MHMYQEWQRILHIVCEKYRKIAYESTCYDDLRYEKITLTYTQS